MQRAFSKENLVSSMKRSSSAWTGVRDLGGGEVCGKSAGRLSAPGCHSLRYRSSANRFIVTETTLYTFNSCRNGCDPIAPVTVDAEGNVYGTTFSGGPNMNLECSSRWRTDPVVIDRRTRFLDLNALARNLG
jgi:hypothetical protein